ncbi:MAG: class I adenylate-forming enzyme family protein [Peptococcaceae bacterium]|nr:class I adenylate-forming enzyme family protein [Peptococcaceae bacterium]
MRGTLLSDKLVARYMSAGYWDGSTIIDNIENNLVAHPDDEAIVDARHRLTWGDVSDLTDTLGLAFHDLGIKRDQVVIIQLPNIVEHYLLVIAFRKAGIISLCVPMTYRNSEMLHALRYLDAVGIIVPYKYRNFDYYEMVTVLSRETSALKCICVAGNDVPADTISLNRLMESRHGKNNNDLFNGLRFGPWDVSQLISTSGTTGLPKFVELAEAPLKCSGLGVIKQANATKDDVIGVLAPLSGAPGQLSWMAAPQIGAKTVLIDEQDSGKILSILESERVSYLFSVPAQLIRLMRHNDLANYDLGALRAVRTGGAPLEPSLALEVEKQMRCQVLPSGGCSEVRGYGYITVNDPEPVRLSTLGKPPYGNKVMICDDDGNQVCRGEVGEIWVTGAEMSQGYYRSMADTNEAFIEREDEIWYRTGDTGKVDEDGNLLVSGRIKDMILRGGQNIFPKEIEDILVGHPHIAAVAIVGMPDPAVGEKSCAYVVLEGGAGLTLSDVVLFLDGSGLARFKMPERLEIVECLPVVSDIQKVDKKALRRDVEGKLRLEGKIR